MAQKPSTPRPLYRRRTIEFADLPEDREALLRLIDEAGELTVMRDGEAVARFNAMKPRPLSDLLDALRGLPPLDDDFEKDIEGAYQDAKVKSPREWD